MKRIFLLRSLEIVSLSNLAIAQPILQLLGIYPEFLIARHLRLLEIVCIVVLLCFLLPSALFLLELVPVLFRRQRAHEILHVVILCLLLFLTGLLLMKQLGINYAGDLFSICGAAFFMVVCAFLYLRWSSTRTFFQMLSPALLVVPALFLLNPSIRRVYSLPAAPSFPRIQSHTNVLLIIFDEFSGNSLMDGNREIDSVRFPHFASLLRNFTWYRNASAAADESAHAVPAILTGQYPQSGKKPNILDYPGNLFSLLAPSYELKVFESITDLLPRQSDTVVNRFEYLGVALDLVAVYLQLIVPEGYASAFPTIGGTWGNFWGSSAIKSQTGNEQMFRQFLDSIDVGSKQTLYFLHILCPHQPWYFFPSGRTYNFRSIGYLGIPVCGHDQQWGDDYWPVVLSLQRYLLQLGYVDKLIGELIERLQQKQRFDSSLIIFTADHGISFGPGDYIRSITESNHADTMIVPLFIKLPGQRVGSISDRNVETIDILPTITEVLGTRPNWKVDGISIFDPSISKRTTKKITKFIDHENGDLKTFTPVMGESRILETESNLHLLGTSMDRIYDVGPASNLLEHTVQELSPKSSMDYVVRIQFSENYRAVNPDSDFIPALIAGRIYSNSVKSLALAIAVNGIVRATTQTFSPSRQAKSFGLAPDLSFNKGTQLQYFAVIVPERSFHHDQNDVQVLVLPESDRGTVYLAAKAEQ